MFLRYGAIRKTISASGISIVGASMLCVLALCATAVRAVDEVELSIEGVRGADWQADGLVVRFEFLENNERASLQIETLKLAQWPETLKAVRVECPRVEMSTRTLGCKGARVSMQVPQLGPQVLLADLAYGRRDGSLQFDLRGLKVGAGIANVSGRLRERGWRADATLEGASIDVLRKLLQSAQVVLPLESANGELDLELHARGADALIESLSARGRFGELTMNNESGSVATDGLAFSFAATLAKHGSDWSYEISVKADGGQAYAEPIFVDFGAHALTADSRGSLSESGVLRAEHLFIDHADVLEGAGTAELDFEQAQPLRTLAFQLTKLQFPGAYTSYFQPLLLETNFKSLQTKGSIGGDVLLAEGQPQRLDLQFEGLDVDGGVANVAVHELNGEWHWRAAPEDAEARADSVEAEASRLRWSRGALYGLEFGASELAFTTQAQDFRLLSPSRIPLLDGAIQLDSLRVRNAGSPNVAFIIDAVLQPVSVQRLCEAFGWPEFGGRVGGAISKLRMREGVMTLGTTLHAQVFDGDVTVTDLRLEEPFGQWPRFYSNIGLRNLDLELVTGAFSFGRITGRLSGSIDGLELFNWSPIAFDARLYTPQDDRSQHRISQRAVQNIGSIGGGGAGVTAALSSGVLRFFDDFNYARLGITCKLHNEVCEMSGVGPAPNGGYYLVEGRGLPRINVIGNARRVDWPRLVQQLVAATESEGPVVD